MDEEPTCGKGIAASAGLPAKLAELMTALADTLDAHRPALDLTEPAGKQEDEAYATLVAEQREIARLLEATARRMEGYRALPMASHDMEVMAQPERMAPFARLIAIQRDLIPMLQESVAGGEAMLDETN